MTDDARMIELRGSIIEAFRQQGKEVVEFKVGMNDDLVVRIKHSLTIAGVYSDIEDRFYFGYTGDYVEYPNRANVEELTRLMVERKHALNRRAVEADGCALVKNTHYSMTPRHYEEGLSSYTVTRNDNHKQETLINHKGEWLLLGEKGHVTVLKL